MPEAGIPGLVVHLSAHGSAADEGELPADVGTGEDERGVCAGENQRAEVLRVSEPPVRDRLHQRDADEPVRAERQLSPGTQPRVAGPDTALPRGEGAGTEGGDMLGRRQPVAGIPVRGRPGQPVCVPDEPLQRQRDGERGYRQGTDHP